MYSSLQQKCQQILEDPFLLLHIKKKERKKIEKKKKKKKEKFVGLILWSILLLGYKKSLIKPVSI